MRKRKPQNIHHDLIKTHEYSVIEKARKYYSRDRYMSRPVCYGWREGRHLYVLCPLCGAIHCHSYGPDYSHRIAHCPSVIEGRENGYFFVTLPGPLPDVILDADKKIDRVHRRYYERRTDAHYRNDKFNFRHALYFADNEKYGPDPLGRRFQKL